MSFTNQVSHRRWSCSGFNELPRSAAFATEKWWLLGESFKYPRRNYQEISVLIHPVPCPAAIRSTRSSL